MSKHASLKKRDKETVRRKRMAEKQAKKAARRAEKALNRDRQTFLKLDETKKSKQINNLGMP